MKFSVPIFHSFSSSDIKMFFACGAVGVIPTDTIYGISVTAKNPQSVERVYDIRLRDRKKPFIVLIASLDDLALFDIHPDDNLRKELLRMWPAPVSIILPCPSKKYAYLHRGTRSIAFRMPAWRPLRSLLKKTGPLITTSVNPEGEKPAETISQAKKYFGDGVDFYVDGGIKKGRPSTLLQYKKHTFEVLRRGAYTSTFQERIYEIVKKIPKGSTMTYGEVAHRAGRPMAYRAVGTLLSKNWDPGIPCHRVIRADGTMGGYNRGPKEKSRKLAQEKL